MTEQQARQKLVLAFKGWLGYNEVNGKLEFVKEI